MITFWIASRSIFGRFWAPTWPPRGVTDLCILEHFSLLGPLGPKMPPRPLQEASWEPQDPSKMPLGTDFRDCGLQLHSFSSQHDLFSTLNLVDLTANQPSNQTTRHPDIPTSQAQGRWWPAGQLDISMYVCMHVCLYLCVYVCMYVCVCTYVCKYVYMYVCKYVCM